MILARLQHQLDRLKTLNPPSTHQKHQKRPCTRLPARLPARPSFPCPYIGWEIWNSTKQPPPARFGDAHHQSFKASAVCVNHLSLGLSAAPISITINLHSSSTYLLIPFPQQHPFTHTTQHLRTPSSDSSHSCRTKSLTSPTLHQTMTLNPIFTHV